MWTNSTSTMNSYNVERSTLECNSNYFKESNAPLVQPEASTAYDTSCDLIGTNDMFLEEYHKMWNLDEPLLNLSPCSNPELSYLYENMSPLPNSDGLQELLSSPMNVQQASKFPEQSFSELISGDLSYEAIDKIYNADRFGMNPYNDNLAESTYTKDDFEFDFGSSMGSSIGSSYFSPPAVEMNTGTKFTPSRSSTPVESPNATQDYINGFQYSMPSDQNYEYYLSNHQNDVKLQQEIDGWGRQIEPQVPPSRPSRSYGMATRPLRTFGMASRPLRNFGIASRALKQSNYQSYEPTISRGSTYTSSTKKVKQIVDYCVFCYNNKEVRAVYESHTVRDTKGRCLCPTLRKYVCPICQKDGDEAHTTKYCKEKKILTEEDMRKPIKRYL